MKPSEIARALETAIAIRQPTIVWGPVGIGKSMVTAQVGTALGRRVIDVRAPQLDAVDLRGIPQVANGVTRWCPPGFLPTAADGPTLLFLDELNRAPAMVQNALLQLVLDRKIGEYHLPDTCEIVSACNRMSDGGGVQKMTSALANRFTHLPMEADLDDWCRWAVQSDIEPAVIAFLRFRPELLCKPDRNEMAFPTPRTWGAISRITAAKPGNGVEHGMYCGTIGTGAATEYSAFLRLFRELPNVDAILLNPMTSPLPAEPATMFAVSSALARRATQQNLARVLQYTGRMQAEYGVYAMQDALRRDETLKATPEFTRWAVDHADVLF